MAAAKIKVLEVYNEPQRELRTEDMLRYYKVKGKPVLHMWLPESYDQASDPWDGRSINVGFKYAWRPVDMNEIPSYNEAPPEIW